MSGVCRFTGAGMEPGGAPRLIAAEGTESGQGGGNTCYTAGERRGVDTPRQVPSNRERRGRKFLKLTLTWWRKPSRPCRHRRTSVPVRCPVREAPPWSVHQPCFISVPLRSLSGAQWSLVGLALPSGTHLISVHQTIDVWTCSENLAVSALHKTGWWIISE